MAPLQDEIEGYWGKPTSTLDWCEENYAVTPYIAEFYNTLSNIIFFAFPIITACIFIRDRVEMRFLLACLGFLTVGIGSWGFHMTLWYEMQLLDEIPMIWGSCVFLFCIFECDSKRDHHNKTLISILILVCALTTTIYVTFKNPYLFQAAYGIIMVVMIYRGFHLACGRCVQYSKYLFCYALLTYTTGFMFWNIDNHFCSQIRAIRSWIPAPLVILTQLHCVWHLMGGFATHRLIVWGYLRQSLPSYLAVLTHLHAWWHLLAGVGTHINIILGCHLRQNVLGRKSEVWHSMGVIPFVKVEEHPSKQENGYQKETSSKQENGYHSNGCYNNGIKCNGDHNKNHYD